MERNRREATHMAALDIRPEPRPTYGRAREQHAGLGVPRHREPVPGAALGADAAGIDFELYTIKEIPRSEKVAALIEERYRGLDELWSDRRTR